MGLGSITHQVHQTYWPQTNGKVERFHRTLATEWAYAQHYGSELLAQPLVLQ